MKLWNGGWLQDCDHVCLLKKHNKFDQTNNICKNHIWWTHDSLTTKTASNDAPKLLIHYIIMIDNYIVALAGARKWFHGLIK